ncbi:unnamed protein product, partial [Mesorhabditis belari]|uniref:Glutaredoxin domain-containing protein n=1 Tax=Mesorhabditis belari TaxID=2138241 RepID=A0AAF3J1Y6_9BILA
MFSSDEKLRPRGYPKFFGPILKDTEENLVILYTKNNCNESKTMRDRLKNEKINFVEKNIDNLSKENPQAAKDYALGLRVIAQSKACRSFSNLSSNVSKRKKKNRRIELTTLHYRSSMGGSTSQHKQELPKICDPIVEEVRQNSVVMYSTTSCGYCKMAKDLLRNEEIEFVEKDIEAMHKNSPEQATQYVKALQIITKKTTVPQIFICKQHIGGYTDLDKVRPRLHEMISRCDLNHKKPSRSVKNEKSML